MTSFNDLPPIKLVIVATKLFHSINDQLDIFLKELDINKSEFLILHALASVGSSKIQTLGDQVNISSSTTTYTIDKLEKRGLIKRVPSKKDRRIIHIELTNEGDLLWEKTKMDHLKHLEYLLEDIPSQSLEEVIALMGEIGKSIDSK